MGLFIPTFPNVPNYSISTNLGGTFYRLTFRLSERESCYYIDLALTDGTPLVSGKKLVCSVSIWGRQRYNPLVPQGHVLCVAATGLSAEPPSLGELGDGRRCGLFYVTAQELGY